MARRSAPNTRADLSEGRPGTARMVTCNGYRGSTFARVSCGIDGRPRGFRPAPFRAPPHLLATGSCSRSCRLPADLIPRMPRLSARDGLGLRGDPRGLNPRMLRGGATPDLVLTSGLESADVGWGPELPPRGMRVESRWWRWRAAILPGGTSPRQGRGFTLAGSDE